MPPQVARGSRVTSPDLGQRLQPELRDLGAFAARTRRTRRPAPASRRAGPARPRPPRSQASANVSPTPRRCRRGRAPASRRSGGRGSARSRRPRGRSRRSSRRGSSAARRRGRRCRGRPPAARSAGSRRLIPASAATRPARCCTWLLHGRDGEDRAGERDPGGDVRARAGTRSTNWSGHAGVPLAGRDVRADDRAHDRDAERAADLAHAVQHGRADARLVDRAPSPSRRPSSASSPSPSRLRRRAAPGSRFQKVEFASSDEKISRDERDEQDHPAAHQPARADRGRTASRPPARRG